MMWTKPQVVMILSSNSLELVDPKKSLQYSLAFDPKVCQYGEVLNEKKFGEVLKNFFDQAPIAGSLIIFLAEDLVFSVPLEGQTETEIKAQHEHFLQLLPLNEERVVSLENPAKSGKIFAANSEFFTLIGQIAQQNQLHLMAVVPLQLLQLEQNSPNSLELAQETMKKYQKRHHPSFEFSLKKNQSLATEVEDGEQSEEQAVLIRAKNKPRASKAVILMALIVIFLEVLLVVMLFRSSSIVSRLNTRYNSFTNTPPETPPPTSSATPVPSATPAELQKNLQIKVINASGKAGAAKKLQTLLSAAGYQSIEVGNASLSTESGTIIKHLATVSAHVAQQVATTVGTSNIQVTEAQTSEVVVQIGK